MATLTCPLSSLSEQLQHRTLVSHTILGIARYFMNPDDVGENPHPLDFAFMLGLSSKVGWYPTDYSQLHEIPKYLAKEINYLVAFCPRPIWDLDPMMLSIRMKMLVHSCEYLKLSPERAMDCLRLVAEHQSISSPLFSTTQRVTIMQAHDFSKVPQDIYQKLDSTLASLEQALLEKDPMMKNHLRESHALLISYPETVVLLKPNEINTLIKAAEQHTQTEIVKAIATSKSASGIAKGKRAVSTDDI